MHRQDTSKTVARNESYLRIRRTRADQAATGVVKPLQSQVEERKGALLKHKKANDYILYDQRSYDLGWSNGRRHGLLEAAGIVLVIMLVWRFAPWLWP